MADVSEDGRIKNNQAKIYKDVKKGFRHFAMEIFCSLRLRHAWRTARCFSRKLIEWYWFGSEFHVLRPRMKSDTEYIYHLTMADQFRASAKGL
jgi:hypothetical protein